MSPEQRLYLAAMRSIVVVCCVWAAAWCFVSFAREDSAVMQLQTCATSCKDYGGLWESEPHICKCYGGYP